MLNFLFNKKEENKSGKSYGFTPEKLSEIYAKLKEIYKFDEISSDRKDYLKEKIEKYGYLPYPHIKALEELTPAEVLLGIEIKFAANEIFKDGIFNYATPSPLARKEVKNSDWIKKEGHEIKLINLAALGDGNKSKETAKFIDWLRQLLILPSGNSDKNILPTTIYLIPFQEREFGCAYLPKSSDVSENLEDKNLKEVIDLGAKEQVQLFITLAQLAGHPVIYDVLPQTGRFAKIVLANPYIARWFDINELLEKICNSVDKAGEKLEKEFDKEDVQIVKDIYKQGSTGELSQDYKEIYDELEKSLDEIKKEYSNEMAKKENQIKLQKKVCEIVAQIQGDKPDKKYCENEITRQNEIISELIKKGLWSLPGGAWCSAGVPVFDTMSECGSFPVFKHYDYKGEDVSSFANLDCQTPFYFAFLENGQENKPVVDFFVQYLENLALEYNFDGFRVDHVDHVVDEISEQKGLPISYRVPRKVLAKLNSVVKSKIPHFASLAEYMLGGEKFSEYHNEMKFDILWGNDIIAQNDKIPEKIVDDNQDLAVYNAKKSGDSLSILKTYNNQDGEFKVIDRYPAQLGEKGALFKWFKYKFLPGGKNAQRPVLYVDGDESFTKTGIEITIGNEVSLKRAKNYEFFAQFDAISRFAKSQELITEGEAQIMTQDEDGFVSWMISKEPMKTAFLIVANYNPPSEKVSVKDEDGLSHTEIKEGYEVSDKELYLPCDYRAKSEFIFERVDFVEKEVEIEDNMLKFDIIKPSEFRVFLLTK